MDSFLFVPRNDLVFVDRRWSNEDNARVLKLDEGVIDDFFEIVFVVFERDVLASRCIGKSSVVGAKEDGLNDIEMMNIYA